MYSTNPKSYEKFTPASPSPILYDIAESTAGVPVIPATTMHVKGSQPSTAKHKKERGPWSTGLCDCSSNCRNCCITFWCPCITFGQVAEIVDRGSSSCGSNGALYTLVFCVTGFCCFYSCFYRTKMRQHYGLKESPCGDCLVHCCCEYCALCQEYRELKFHGYDMAIGWHGNLEKRHREATMAPMVEEGMTR